MCDLWKGSRCTLMLPNRSGPMSQGRRQAWCWALVSTRCDLMLSENWTSLIALRSLSYRQLFSATLLMQDGCDHICHAQTNKSP